jgi:AraC family transcriptional regulator of adaptative response/methylated-DNA-[protein]-cysteine methyltransferase
MEMELNQYFDKSLKKFETPIMFFGSDFQKNVWKQLQNIKMGETVSYKDLAISLGNQKAVRAIGNANGADQLSIIVPCHRVIQSNGTLGGYGGGLERKKWLLTHEKTINTF